MGPAQIQGKDQGSLPLNGGEGRSHYKRMVDSTAVILRDKSTMLPFTSLQVQITLQIASFDNFYMGGRINICRIHTICRVLC